MNPGLAWSLVPYLAVHEVRLAFGGVGLAVTGAILGLTDLDALTISMARTARLEEVRTAAAFAGKLRQAGVMVSVSGAFRGRACLHLDVTAAGVEEALSVMRDVVR